MLTSIFKLPRPDLNLNWMEAPGTWKSSLKITSLYRLIKIETKFTKTSKTLQINHEWIKKPLALRKPSISSLHESTWRCVHRKKLNLLKKNLLQGLSQNQDSGEANFENAISKLPTKFSWSQSVMFWISLDLDAKNFPSFILF